MNQLSHLNPCFVNITFYNMFRTQLCPPILWSLCPPSLTLEIKDGQAIDYLFNTCISWPHILQTSFIFSFVIIFFLSEF